MATYTDNYNLIKPSYSEIADVATINTNMNTIDDIMHSTQVSLAPAYDSTQTYNTDDVVMYELLMYKCKENNVTGTWNASKWERTTASECGDSGSDVEANPSGTATEELNKLRVDNTIYSIPEGSEVVVYGEARGSIAEFDDGSNKPMSKCKIDINAVQSGSGDPSPTNVRPISGFNGGNVNVSPTTNAQDGTTYSVSWQSQAGTVYGGNVDLVSGVLTVTHGMADLGDLTWTYVSTQNFFNADTTSIGMKSALSIDLICENYKYMGRAATNAMASAQTGTIYHYNETSINKIMVRVKDTDYTDATAFKTAMNGVKLVYELATPLTYQLTPIQVNSLLGINNVWNDTNGETEVKYIRDLNTTVNQLVQHLTYGYGGTPSFNGNDGDVHIVLNSLNKKKGEFMWLNNQWTLIEGSGEVALKVYDNGVEGVAWSVTGGTKNTTNISLTVGSGTFTNYAITDTAVNVTNYSTLTVVCKYRDQNYTKVIDLTNVSGNKYISFLYVTDSNHNECAVGLTDTNSPSPTYRVDSRNGGTAECIMYSCTLE